MERYCVLVGELSFCTVRVDSGFLVVVVRKGGLRTERGAGGL